MMSYKKLTKSDDKIFAGICGGMAEYLDFDPTVVRVAYATLTLFTAFSGIILYFVLWFIIPKKEITQ
ncbi:MAG: PspC domain-containing protein [Prevotella sp.]|nr:PspC domain-containing protein [Prevotella sp.]MDD6736892.1 PspC domain-containing protein [Prevotella sp.]MDY6091602.1 PspC domain-containing protein [Prevotella sp.]